MFAYLLVGWFLAQPQVVSNLTAPNPLDISPEIRSYLDDKVHSQ